MEAGDFHSGQEHKVRIRPDSQQGIHTYVYISIDLVFYIMSLWSRALGSLPSAWLMELWALPYPFDPTVVQPKARLVRAASSVEISHHLWSVLEHPRPGSIPVIYLLCRSWQCWFQCQHYRDWFVSTSFSLLQCVAIQGLVVCWQWSRRQHRLIDSSTRHHSSATNWFDSIRFVDKAFVIRALHLRAPSATALLEETLQCSKCVCNRTVCVCEKCQFYSVVFIGLGLKN